MCLTLYSMKHTSKNNIPNEVYRLVFYANSFKNTSHGLTSSYFIFRDGRSLTDSEVIGMLIGLLLAGQHTSSTTSAWLGFFLAKNKSLQVRKIHNVMFFNITRYICRT